MSRTWLHQLRKHLRGGTNGSRPPHRQPRSVRPTGEFLEARALLSGGSGLIGGGLVGDPPDPPDPGDRPPRVHWTVVHEDTLTQLSATQWDMNQPYSGTIANFGSPQAKLTGVGSGLPPGLNVTKSGSTIVFSGTPTQTGRFDFGLEADDQVGNNGTMYVGGYTLTINPPLGLGGQNAAWTAGQVGSATIAVSGGTSPFGNLAVTGLPPGLTAALSPNAITLSGTPTQAGTFSNVAVSLQDGIGATVRQTYSLTVGLGLSPGTLPADTAGQSYSAMLDATGGSGRYLFTLASGALPTGLALSPAGLLSGTATGPASPSYHFTVQATDAANAGVSGTQAYTLALNPAAASQLVISTPATVSAGSSFQAGVMAFDAFGNGVDNVPVTLGGLTVPTSYGPDGHGDGYAGFNMVAPTRAGNFMLTASAPGVASVTTAYTVVGAYPHSIVVSPSTTTPVAGHPFNVTLTLQDAWGNTSDYYGSVMLSSSDGQLAPTTVTAVHGTVITSVTLDIARSLTLTAVYGPLAQGTSGTITVQPGAPSQLVFSTQPPSSVDAGSPFSAVVLVKDAYGVAGSGNPVPGVPVSISISPGMLSSMTTSVITDQNGQAAFNNLTENMAGTYVLNASVAMLPSNASTTFTVTPVVVATVAVSPSTPTPTSGMGFSVTVMAKDRFSNGTMGTVHFTSSDPLAVLPPDYSLTSTDQGTHTFPITLKTPGSQSITAEVTSPTGGVSVSNSSSVTVSKVTLTLNNPAVLPAATVSQNYTMTFTATGGTGPYTFALTSGTLPKGLALSSSGVLSGTTFVAGTYHFTVQVAQTNNPAANGSLQYTLTVNRMQGDFTQATLTSSPSPPSGNVTATVSGNGMSPTVDFRINTSTGIVDSGAIPEVWFAISPHGRVGVVIPPLMGNGAPEVDLYNLGIDQSQGGGTHLGSHIDIPGGIFVNWSQFWFSPDDSLLVIIGQGGQTSVFTADVYNTVTGQHIGYMPFNSATNVTRINLSQNGMHPDILGFYTQAPDPAHPGMMKEVLLFSLPIS